MATFNGQLRPNEVFGSLWNMIISLQVFGDNIKGTNSQLVSEFRTDGSMFGDSKLYFATDCLHSHPWGQGPEVKTGPYAHKGEKFYSENLLAVNRPKDPEVQRITLSVFRQITVSVDNYLTKRAWGDEYAFSQFNAITLQWIGETKRIYDSTLMNAFVGTVESKVGKQQINIQLEKGATVEETNRLEAGKIAETLANIKTEITDVSRDFNDYGFMRSLDWDDLVIVWNSKYVNKLTKLDLPTIFHDDKVMSNLFKHSLPSKYFGKVKEQGEKITSDNYTDYRLLKEVGDETKVGGGNATITIKPAFAGEKLDATVGSDGIVGLEDLLYKEDDSIVCKIMHKNSIPFMSTFEVGTSFFNPSSLIENHYLTFSHSDLDYLKNYPMITVRVTQPVALKK